MDIQQEKEPQITPEEVYLQSLSEFTDDAAVVPGSRFRDNAGNFHYQRRNGQHITIIPPTYQDPIKQSNLKTFRQSLDANLQFSRNNLALSSPASPSYLQVVERYNTEIDRSDQIDGQLRHARQQKNSVTAEDQEQLTKLQEETETLLKVSYHDGKLVKSGTLHEQGLAISSLAKQIHFQTAVVFPDTNPKPRIYELSSNKVPIPNDEEGDKLQLLLQEWTKLQEGYGQLHGQYTDNLVKMAKIEAQITKQQGVNKFHLSSASQPAQVQVSNQPEGARFQPYPQLAQIKPNQPQPMSVPAQQQIPVVQGEPQVQTPFLAKPPEQKLKIKSKIPIKSKITPQVKTPTLPSSGSPTVACVKVKDIRPQYGDLREWMADPNNVYIGRKGVVFIDNQRFPKENSPFYNPFVIDKDGDREQVIQLYKEYILKQIENKTITRKDLEQLQGKTLGCWCAPEPCHGDVLKEIVDNLDNYFQEEPQALPLKQVIKPVEKKQLIKIKTKVVAEPLLFYGHDRAKQGDDAVFSNWFPSPFTDDSGLNFYNVEQYMMYQKAKLFNDPEMAAKIMTTKNGNPKTVKAYGRKVKDFNDKIWAENREQIVCQGTYYKFSQNPELLAILLNTGDRLLVEASPSDRIWGIGLSKVQAKNVPQDQWPGLNLLGKCLVQTRSKLRAGL